jgi:hypothetical protein
MYGGVRIPIIQIITITYFSCVIVKGQRTERMTGISIINVQYSTCTDVSYMANNVLENVLLSFLIKLNSCMYISVVNTSSNSRIVFCLRESHCLVIVRRIRCAIIITFVF